MKNKIFLILSLFLGFCTTSCNPASQQIVLNNAVDYGLHQLKKEVKLIKLDVPVRSLDDQMYSTPLGFFHFWIVQREDSLIINALPQYEVIQDSIKSFIQKQYNKGDTLGSYFPKVQKSKIHTLMLKDLHKSIEERLAQEVPEIKWIDVWNNQFAHEGKEYPFPLPACFISLHRIDFLQDNGIKSANVEIKLHLGQEVYLDTFHKAEHKDLALSRYDLIDKICEVLEGYQNDSHSPMELGSVDLDDDYSSLIKNVMTVYTTYTSC